MLFSTGCPKTDAVQDAAPVSSAVASVSQVTLAPIGDQPTAIVSATLDPLPLHTTPMTITTSTLTRPTTSGAPTASAHGVSAQAQVKRCCAALRKQSQQPSAQQAQLGQASMACDALVAAMGEAVPQLDQVKTLLAGVPLPPVCQGL